MEKWRFHSSHMSVYAKMNYYNVKCQLWSDCPAGCNNFIQAKVDLGYSSQISKSSMMFFSAKYAGYVHSAKFKIYSDRIHQPFLPLLR